MNAVTTRMKRISRYDDSAVIPPSHKWTEAGALPKDWSVQSLRSCLLSVPSYGINEAAVPFDDNLPTYLRITDISEDGQFRPSPRVCVKHPNGQKYFLIEGDLVLARTGASVGKSYLYNPKDGPLVFAGFLIRISPNPEKLQPAFLAYCLQSKYYWNWVATMSIRSGQPGINGKEYGDLQLPLPSLIEQRAISEVLSDVDGLIRALDALIAKRRAIKQATMQQLLTGKTRLPGFNGEWRKTRIRDLLTYRRPDPYIVQCAEYSQHGDVPVLTANKSFVLGFTDELSGVCQDFPAIIFDDFTTASKYPTFPFKVKSSAIKLLYAKHERVSLKFVFERMQLIRFSLGTHKRYYISEYQNIEVFAPDFDEQKAIAQVLSDFDFEIAVLERRRDKTRAIKQGMMQQLLTGRVRLMKSGAGTV
ncbi:MAG: restriction endonuclease subunit S [Candidatus Poribacteria bacterium]|nr:restriction endonuclease subunit S [Candidatus Poribacteria bacterium]